MALSNAIKQLLTEHGLTAIGRMHDSYFAIISIILDGDARKKNSDIQRQPEFNLFFCAFEPEFLSQNQSKLYQPEKIRQECLNRSRQHRTGPCRRDLYATAELLQQAIQLFHIKEDALERDVFLPTFCNVIPGSDRIIRILMLRVDGKTVFYRMKLNHSRGNIRWPADTNQCDCNKFHKQLIGPSVPVSRRESDLDQVVADHWVYDPPTATNQSFYRCLSTAMYGDEKWFPLIRNLIVKFEQQEDFLPVFQTLITKTKRNETEDVNTKTQNHFAQLTKGSKRPGTGELYAASSLFCTDIFIWNKHEEEWNVYRPLLLPSRTRHHFLTMARHDAGNFELLVPAEAQCNCQLQRPPVRSLKDERRRLESVAWGITAFKSCCKGKKRHDPHTHMQFLVSDHQQQVLGAGLSRTAKHLSTDDEYVEELLKLNGRCLDRISPGTFQQCIYKEIHGTEEIVKTTQFPVPAGILENTEIMDTANWLQRPIYIFTKDRRNEDPKWKAFLPTPVSTECRHYVTLYKDSETNRYDRVIPIEGCNCSKLPPTEPRISTGARVEDDDGRRKIEHSKRHKPMLEYFMDENIKADMFTDENIYPAEDMYPPTGSVLSDIYHVQQRDDMADRMVDTMEGNNSLSACLSKEIFGNSSKDNFIANLILAEIRENGKTYSVLYSGAVNAHEQAGSLGTLQGFGEIDLLAAATFFQTRILVLLVEPDGTSRWKEFSQMRRKLRPGQLPQLQSACLKDGTADKYYVTLLRNAYGEFYRIVPKQSICNCQMEQIRVPGKTNGLLKDGFSPRARDIWAEKRQEAILTCRSLDSALGQAYCDVCNLYRMVAFQLNLHEEIIRIVEKRHRETDIATITGSAVYAVGTTILFGSVAFATGGTSVAVAGLVVSVLGGASIATGTLIEGVLSAKDLENLIKIHNLLKVTSENAVASVGKLDIIRSFALIPGMCILEETCHAVSTLLSRLAVKTASVLLGRLLAGFSLFVDALLLAMAARSLNKGSKTDTSETLRKNVYQLRALKSILKTYIHKADQ